MKWTNLNEQKLLNDSKEFVVTENDSYSYTYNEFLDYFRRISLIEKKHLVISSHFVYGWMPTILQLNLNNEAEVLKYLNAVKSGVMLNNAEVEIVKKAINNSLVGLSKLLHFINPNIYAIWDSRVFRYITANKTTWGISKVENFQEYQIRINQIKDSKSIYPLIESVQYYFDYLIPPLRAIELVMFETDRKLNGKLAT